MFDDFSGIVVYEVKRFFFPKMEAMSKNDVEAETCEHAQNRKHGNALTKPKVEILLVLLLFRLPNTKRGQSIFEVAFNSASTFRVPNGQFFFIKKEKRPKFDLHIVPVLKCLC